MSTSANPSNSQAVVEPPLVGFFHGIRSRPRVRKLLFFGWILLWLVILVVGVEFLSRRYLVPWHQEVGNRHLQPYFMSGGYFQSSFARFKEQDVTRGPGGPESYGYYRQGNIHLYSFENEVSSIAERGDFLFQDRVGLANDTNSSAIRIFVLGGSTAYGIGASSPEKRWHVILERALIAELGVEVNVIPAAMIGYVSTQERLALDLMVLPRRPDAVIILDGFNDAVLPSIFGTRPGDPYDLGFFYQEFYAPLSGVKKWLANHSYFYRFMLYRSLGKTIHEHQDRILNNPQLLRNYANSTASVYLDNVRHMMDVCDSNKIPCLVFLQPVRDVTLRSKGYTKKLDPFTLTSYEEILSRSKELPLGGRFHDLTYVFDAPGGEDHYMDNVHFRDQGQEILAKAMYPVILNAIRELPKTTAKPDTHLGQ